MKRILRNTTILLAVLAICGFTLLGCKRGSLKGENFDADGSYALGMRIGANLAAGGVDLDIDQFIKGMRDMIASGDESYAFGMNVGAGLVADGIVPNMNEFIQGMKDVLAGAELRFSEFEADMIMRAAYQTMMEERQFSALEQENIFLEENSRKPGISVTPSGLQYEIIVETFGQKPTIEDLVRLNYEGRYIDGEIFDSSYERGEPEVLHLGGLIPGMTEALQMMSEGSKYRFFIPSELAYGAGGGPIRPFATLIFEVELLEIIDEADFYSLFN